MSFIISKKKIIFFRNLVLTNWKFSNDFTVLYLFIFFQSQKSLLTMKKISN